MKACRLIIFVVMFLFTYSILIGQDLTPSKYKGKYGYTDAKGKFVIKNKFKEANGFSEGLAAVKKKHFWGYIKKDGDVVVKFRYYQASEFKESYAAVKDKNNKWGYINNKGDEVIPFNYNKAFDFNEGIAKVIIDKKYLLIDKYGNTITPEGYDEIEDFKESYTKVKLDKKYALIWRNGKRFTDWYDNIDKYYQSYAFITSSNKKGLIDNSGKLITSQWYDSIEYFHGNWAKVYLDKKSGFINKTGALITDYWYDSISYYYNNFAIAYLKGKCALLDVNGKRITDPEWYDEIDLNSYQVVNAKTLINVYNQKKCGLIDQYGTRITSEWFDKILPFTGIYSFVNSDGLIGLIDTSGKRITEEWYQNIFPLSNSNSNIFAKISKNNKWSLINCQGKRFIEWYNLVGEASEEMISVKNNSKWGFIDFNSKIIIKFQYDTVFPFYQGFSLVGSKGLLTFINKKGNMTENIWYDNVEFLNNEYLRVLKKNLWTVIDSSKKFITRQWFDQVDLFVFQQPEMICFKVRNDSCVSLMDCNGKLLTSECISDIQPFEMDMALVVKNKQFGLVNEKGIRITAEWYDNINNYKGRIARVSLNGKDAFINKNGKRICNWYDKLFDYSNNMAVVSNNGKFGYIDTLGDLSIPIQFDDAWDFISDYTIVKKDNRYGYIDKKGLTEDWYDQINAFNDLYKDKAVVMKDGLTSLIDAKGKRICNWYQEMGKYVNGYMVVKRDNKWGYINEQWKEVIPASFDDAWDFEGNFAMVKNNGLFAYINKLGALTPDLWFVEITTFSNGLAYVKSKEGWGIINENRKLITDYEWYDHIDNFNSNGLAFVNKKGLVSLIDKSGKRITEWFEFIGPFVEGLARVQKYGKWGYIDINYQLVIAPAFDDSWDFSDGYAMVKQGFEYAYINKYGYLTPNIWFQVIEPYNNKGVARVKTMYGWGLINYGRSLITNNNWYDEIYDFSYNDWAMVKKGGNVSVISVYGNLLTNWYDDMIFGNDGFIRIKQGSKVGLMDKSWKVLLSADFDQINDFEGGYALVKKNNQISYINTNGTFTTQYWFIEVINIGAGLMKVKTVSGWGLLNQNKQLVSGGSWYDEIYDFSEDMAIVKENGKYGYINTSGGVAIKLIYDEAQAFSQGLAKIKYNNKYFFIDKTGVCKKDCPGVDQNKPNDQK